MTIKSIVPTLYPHIRPNSASSSFILDAAEEHLAFFGTFPRSGTLKAVIWSLIASNTPDLTLRVSVETQQSVIGQVVATTDAAKTLYAANAVSADIVNPAAGLQRSEINGSTGVGVTEGDRFAAVIRCISFNSGSVGVRYAQYGTSDFMSYLTNYPANHGAYSYAAGTGAYYGSIVVTLEYSDGIVPMTHALLPNISTATLSWNSSSNPDRRSMKFRCPDYSVHLPGAYVFMDADAAVDAILYGPDGYTVVSGPYNIAYNNRPTNAQRGHYVPLGITCEQNEWYRLALIPTTTTSISSSLYTYADIGAYGGITATHEGTDVLYSTRNGAPSSGDAAWNDYYTQRLPIQLLIDGIDIPSGSGGGGAHVLGQSGLR